MKNSKSIKTFLILVFTLPLISLILIKFVPFFQKGIPYLVLYGFGAATPSISALLTLNLLSSKKQVLSFLKRSYVENIKIKYIILAFLLPAIIGLLTYLLCAIFADFSIINKNIGIEKIIILLWALVAEELGWRGFLQEKLKYLNEKLIPLVIGIIWASWHYYFYLLETISTPIVLFIISCIIDSYIYYWLTIKSKQNIIPASILHFMSNLSLSVLLIYPDYQNGNVLPYAFYIISSFIVMIYFINYKNQKIIKSNLKQEFNCNIEKLWQIITDNTHYTWRSDLSRIEIIDDKHFIEYTKNNFPTYFTITKKDYLKEYHFDIKNANIKGKWSGRFIKINDKKTLLDFTEEIETNKLFIKLLAKPYLKSQQKRYFQDLEKMSTLSISKPYKVQ